MRPSMLLLARDQFLSDTVGSTSAQQIESRRLAHPSPRRLVKPSLPGISCIPSACEAPARAGRPLARVGNRLHRRPPRARHLCVLPGRAVASPRRFPIALSRLYAKLVFATGDWSMKRQLIFAAVTLACLAHGGSAWAQEGCKTVQRSCSQMNTECESRCQNGNNPSACIARLCSVHLSSCKANGVWKPAGGAACWKTNNRS